MRTRAFLRGLSIVKLQQSAESVVATDATDGTGWIARGGRNDVSQCLVVTLGMVVNDKLVDGMAEVTLAERNDVPQTLLPDGSNEAFRVGVQIGAVCGQSQKAHARRPFRHHRVNAA
jgi:hypothetical protein